MINETGLAKKLFWRFWFKVNKDNGDQRNIPMQYKIIVTHRPVAPNGAKKYS